MKTNHTTFYIVRHGESEGNVNKILQGQMDFPLTKAGENQAKKRAHDLKDVTFDAVFASDLMRAHRTAEIIALEHDLTVMTTEALRERSFGKYEGMDPKQFTQEIQEIFSRWYMLTDAEWMKSRLDDTFETGEEMVSRMLTFLREIAVGYPGKTILSVCHGDLMRNLLIHLGWGTKDELRSHAISNTSYFVLKTDGSDFRIEKAKGITKLGTAEL